MGLAARRPITGFPARRPITGLAGCLAAAVAVCLVATVVAACGTSTAGPPAGGTSTAGPSAGGGDQAFTARARQVAARWTRSPLARVWRTGLVLLSPDELISIPPDAGFAGQQQKDAFASGRFTLRGRLPSDPLTGRVRWAAGATATVPLLTAHATFGQLAAGRACAVPPCGHLTVTAARPAVLTVATSRGPATVPAWRFTVAELPFPVTRAAVAPRAYSSLPEPALERTGRLPGSAGVGAVSSDGRVLTLWITTGACISGWGGRVYSAAGAVVVGSWTREANTGAACPAMAVVRKVQVRLPQPLGARVILDAVTGLPLVPEPG